MYSKNLVTSFLNFPSNYIIGSLGSSTRNFLGEKLNGQNYSSSKKHGHFILEVVSVSDTWRTQIRPDTTGHRHVLIVSTARNNGTPWINVGNSTVVPRR